MTLSYGPKPSFLGGPGETDGMGPPQEVPSLS